MTNEMNISTFEMDIKYEDTLVPLVESITGRQGQDAFEHLVVACIENFLEPQDVIDALHSVQVKAQGLQ